MSSPIGPQRIIQSFESFVRPTEDPAAAAAAAEDPAAAAPARAPVDDRVQHIRNAFFSKIGRFKQSVKQVKQSVKQKITDRRSARQEAVETELARQEIDRVSGNRMRFDFSWIANENHNIRYSNVPILKAKINALIQEHGSLEIDFENIDPSFFAIFINLVREGELELPENITPVNLQGINKVLYDDFKNPKITLKLDPSWLSEEISDDSFKEILDDLDEKSVTKGATILLDCSSMTLSHMQKLLKEENGLKLPTKIEFVNVPEDCVDAVNDFNAQKMKTYIKLSLPVLFVHSDLTEDILGKASNEQIKQMFDLVFYLSETSVKGPEIDIALASSNTTKLEKFKTKIQDKVAELIRNTNQILLPELSKRQIDKMTALFSTTFSEILERCLPPNTGENVQELIDKEINDFCSEIESPNKEKAKEILQKTAEIQIQKFTAVSQYIEMGEDFPREINLPGEICRGIFS